MAQVVLPGDQVDANDAESTKIALGPGLQKVDERVVVCKPGLLKHKKSQYWVDSHQKRYIPTKGEQVIGIVSSKAGDIFRVDIGGSALASLSYLAFEGATKRNRPDVKVGDILFAKLVAANKDIEPELVCIDSFGRGNGMGVIRDGGYLITCTLSLVHKILSKDCILLKELGKHLPFEITVGMNGKVWVKGRSLKETLVLSNCIKNAEFMTNDQISTMCLQAVNALAGF